MPCVKPEGKKVERKVSLCLLLEYVFLPKEAAQEHCGDWGNWQHRGGNLKTDCRN